MFQRNTVPLKILDHCKWLPEIMTVLLKCMAASAPFEITIRLKEKYMSNTLYIYIYMCVCVCVCVCVPLMVASALLQNTVSIEEWFAATLFVKQRNYVL